MRQTPAFSQGNPVRVFPSIAEQKAEMNIGSLYHTLPEDIVDPIVVPAELKLVISKIVPFDRLTHLRPAEAFNYPYLKTLSLALSARPRRSSSPISTMQPM